MESLRFDQASDVWSFGVLMVEVFGNGARPYADMPTPAITSGHGLPGMLTGLIEVRQ